MRFDVRYLSGKRGLAAVGLFAISFAGAALAADKRAKKAPVPENTSKAAILWKDPVDINTRDLYYGPGGKEHEPHGPFQFVKEDLDGTNPKFVVTDASGVKWKVKLGIEARPETAASRLVWAAGYFTNEDYFLADLKVEGMQKLRRGNQLVSPDGSMRNVRLKREDEKKTGTWRWQDNPFTGTPEWNGLRTLMAVINNWDVKDENNAVYKEGSGLVYLVSDLGASFGAADRSWPASRSKDNLQTYSQSKFIRRVSGDTVDFQSPGRPSPYYLPSLPEFIRRVHLERIGRGIPRADAKRIGEVLARLSHEQITAAFRASGYSPSETEGFSEIFETRIRALTDL